MSRLVSLPNELFINSTSNTIHKIDPAQLSNSTHAQLALLFPQMEENIPSLVNSGIFLISYLVVMTMMGVIVIRYWKEMKRNQKIIYYVVFWCILQQSFGLIMRTAYNSYALWMNQFSDYTKIENMTSKLITLAVLSLLESLAVYGQGVTVVVVVGCILNMFMDTIRTAGGFTTKVYTTLKYTLNILIGIGVFVIVICILLNVGIELAEKLVEIDVDVFPILVVVFLTFIVILVLESIVFIVMGVKLVNIIKRSHHVTQLNKQLHFLQKPETKIIGLMIGMLLSAFLQILAAIVSIMTGELATYLHVIDYFLQAGGILLFSIFVLLVHNPLLSFNLDKGNKQQDIPLSQAVSSTDKQKSTPRLQSQRYSSKQAVAVTVTHNSTTQLEKEESSPVVEDSTTTEETPLELEEKQTNQV